jgi:hypothetical protein
LQKLLELFFGYERAEIADELRPKVGDEGVRRRIVGVFNASTSPPKE